MYIPLTWKNDEGEVTTKSNKSELTKRLYLLERFLSLIRYMPLEPGRV